MELSASEFLRRFLLHVLPGGLERIRHYGILSNRHRHDHLVLCRMLLTGAGPVQAESQSAATVPTTECSESITATQVCPQCGAGRMILIAEFPPLASGEDLVVGTERYVLLVSS
jgi:hypothetical protein